MALTPSSLSIHLCFCFTQQSILAVIVSFIWMYNTVVKSSQIKKGNPVEMAFYEQNKMALQENIETIECALKNNSIVDSNVSFKRSFGTIDCL